MYNIPTVRLAKSDNKNELEAREEILAMVDEYCKKYHNQKQYKEGDRKCMKASTILFSLKQILSARRRSRDMSASWTMY